MPRARSVQFTSARFSLFGSSVKEWGKMILNVFKCFLCFEILFWSTVGKEKGKNLLVFVGCMWQRFGENLNPNDLPYRIYIYNILYCRICKFLSLTCSLEGWVLHFFRPQSDQAGLLPMWPRRFSVCVKMLAWLMCHVLGRCIWSLFGVVSCSV